MSRQFKADVDILTTADSGWRDPRDCLWGMFHTTEDPEGKDPEVTARWQQDPSNDSSYNVLFGDTGKTVRSNDDDYQPWAAGQPANRLAFHGSAVGKAARTRAEWLKRPAQLESMARWAADLHTRYGLPLKWLTEEEVRRRVKGFTSHGVYWRAIGRAQGMAVRTDPGDGFPHDVVLDRARVIAGGGAKVTPPTPSSSSSSDLDLALDQLAGHPWREFPGWPQLGDRTIVNALAVIGEKLGIPGFKDLTRNEKNDR